VRAGQPDYLILGLVAVLLVLGLITVYSASFAVGQLEYNDATYFAARQALWAGVGVLLLLFFMHSDYRLLRYASPLMMVVAVASLMAVLVPGIGLERNGATRWLALGPLPPVQPSEFAKLALIIYISAWLAGRGRDVRSFAMGLVPFVVLVGMVGGLILLEPDLGTTIVIVLTMLALFFVAGASLTHLVALLMTGGVAASLLIAAGGYRADRMFAFISAEDEPGGRGFHILQLLISLGTGGISGLGLGASRQKFFYIPGAHTDGVFAIIGEELGFIGAVAVIALFGALVFRGLRVMLHARDDFGALLAVGVTTWIAFQTLINIGGITRSIPLTGIPLPFLSYGGSALAAVLAGVGILLSVSRYGSGQRYTGRDRRVAPAGSRAPALSFEQRPGRTLPRRGAG